MAVEVEGVAEVRSPTVSRDVNRARDETGAQGPPPRRGAGGRSRVGDGARGVRGYIVEILSHRLGGSSPIYNTDQRG